MCRHLGCKWVVCGCQVCTTCVCVGNGGVIGKTEILRRSVRLERKARMNVSPREDWILGIL